LIFRKKSSLTESLPVLQSLTYRRKGAHTCSSYLHLVSALENAGPESALGWHFRPVGYKGLKCQPRG